MKPQTHAGITEIYQGLKWRYFKELASPLFYKGDVRAFVGLRTWHYETRLLEEGLLPHEAHVFAFERAIDEIATANEISFKKAFTETLDDWKESQKTSAERNFSYIWPGGLGNETEPFFSNGFSVVSLFSGVLGLDLGFHLNGFEVRLANDIEPLAAEAARLNMPALKFLCCDINDTTPADILRESGLKRGKVDVLIGGPPCQPFSTAGKRLGFNDVRSSPIIAFLAAVKVMQPRIFVMEEVTGLLSSRLEHVPEAERDEDNLTGGQAHGSAFRWLISQLDATGYKYVYKVLNAADFGAPQTRNRIIFIGAREATPSLPEATHGLSNECDLFNSKKEIHPWVTFWEATANLPHEVGVCGKYAKGIAPLMKLVPPGGYWRHLPEAEIPAAMGGAHDAIGGKMGFYRRLAWDEPAPTVVTSPAQKGTIFGHPYEQRPLSVGEFKRLQGLPDAWAIPGASAKQYKLIGNAVSVQLASAIAKHVAKLLEARKK